MLIQKITMPLLFQPSGIVGFITLLIIPDMRFVRHSSKNVTFPHVFCSRMNFLAPPISFLTVFISLNIFRYCTSKYAVYAYSQRYSLVFACQVTSLSIFRQLLELKPVRYGIPHSENLTGRGDGLIYHTKGHALNPNKRDWQRYQSWQPENPGSEAKSSASTPNSI